MLETPAPVGEGVAVTALAEVVDCVGAAGGAGVDATAGAGVDGALDGVATVGGAALGYQVLGRRCDKQLIYFDRIGIPLRSCKR